MASAREIAGGVEREAVRLQHFLYFFPLPQGQGPFRPMFTFDSVETPQFKDDSRVRSPLTM